jgi:error-prone DNA polymerase
MAGTPPYAELHCHSAYSFLDGVSLPRELAERAGELGYESLALTDHNTVSGSMEHAQAVACSGVRALHGAEIDLTTDGAAGAGTGEARACGAGREQRDLACSRHLTLLVRDGRGWSNLCRILTIAHADTRDRRPARGEPRVRLATVLDHAEGLVCLTGCAERGVHDEPTARMLLDGFGPENVRVELQRGYGRHDRARNHALRALARRLGVRCVATGNVHAHARARAELQDAFVALRHHRTLDASEPLRRGNHSHVLACPRAMVSRFVDHPEAVRETLRVAEQLRFDLRRDLGYRYPGAEDPGMLAGLSELCHARIDERYGPGAHVAADGRADHGTRPDTQAGLAEARARLEQELKVIEQLGLAGFFLLHYDILELAREVALEVRGPDSARALLAPGRGRGSSVSSIVCYLIGLSHIDPVANQLLLGRFLHQDLRELPDIDLDFSRGIRERLIPRVHERYGRERTALVAAFPTFRARGAIRELGKVLGLPVGELERVARGADMFGATEQELTSLVPAAGRPGAADAAPATAAPGRSPAAAPARSPRWDWLARLVAEAQRLPRHLSQHPGGMVVATRPLIDCCPVEPAAMAGRQMVQWDKDSCADAGFLKIDLLGLGMLSAVERCVDTIADTRGKRIDLSRIPFDDAQTFEAIQTADTVGVFQIESRAQMQSLRRTRPSNLDELAVQVAIIRPGPIQGGAINPYIERRQRLRRDPTFEIPYDHPSLRPVLEETLGTVIFQDQVIQVAEVFAGFSPGEADGLRRAMSRKHSEQQIQRQRERFIAGARAHVGADQQTAERVWEMVVGFAGFGFPKSHSAAFGLLAYQSTWLRVHYGPEFLCALLNEQPMGFYAPDSLVHEAQLRGIPVLQPDVNASQVECTVEPVGVAEPARAADAAEPIGTASPAAAAGSFGKVAPAGAAGSLAVRLGLGYVKGVVADELRELVDAREREGAFRDLGELAARVAVGRTTLEQLAWSGACDELVKLPSSLPEAPASTVELPGGAQQKRRLALWQLGLAATGQGVGARGQPERATQLALPLDLPRAPRLRPLSRWQRLIADYSTTGVTVGDHAIAALRPRLTRQMLATSAQLSRLPTGSTVTVAGLAIARQRPGTAKGTMFLLLEDEWGTINLVVSRAVYEAHRQLARTEPLLLARGRLERAADAPSVINVVVRELAALERHLDSERQPVAEIGASMRAVAPPVQSFAMGRRR